MNDVTLAAQFVFSEQDFNIAFALLEKEIGVGKFPRTDFILTYSGDGEHEDINISALVPDESVQMCLAMLMFMYSKTLPYEG